MAVGEKTTAGGRIWYASATVDPASLAANTSAQVSVTVTGARYDSTLALCPDKILAVIPPTALNAGLTVGPAYVTAADTVSFRLINATTGTIDAASGTYEFLIARF